MASCGSPAIQGSGSPSAHSANVFVGRERELAELCLALEDSIAGRGRLALIAGEPGIGKTRLADELAGRASDAGARILWGRCWEGEGAPAFWPWVQIIRAVTEGLDPSSLGALVGARAARIAQIVPELGERLGTPPHDLSEEEPDRARFHLFEAVASFLRDAAASQPLLIIIDDLQWADPSSLLLFKFVSAELRGTRIFLLGIYREIEAMRAERVREVVGDVVREAREITLRGFDDSEVGRFIAETSASDPPEALVRAVHEATGGNPFFVSEVVRLLSDRYGDGQWTEAAPRSLPLPPSVRATIRRRLDTLPEGSRELLAVASFIGREFDVVTLERASGLGRELVLDRLGDAVADGFAQRMPNAVAGYRFAHDLVRETFCDDASPAERVRLHLRVGETIEELHRSTLESHVSELAHHFAEAAAGGDPEKALDYSMRAGEHANGTLAYEEAVEHFERAKRIVELYELRDDSFRFELLLALGEAQKRAGENGAAKETFRVATAMAEAFGSPEDLARAALGYPFPFGGFGSSPRPVDETLIGWLRRALDGIAPEDTDVHARLLSRLAIELYFSPAWSETFTLSAEAVRLARAGGHAPVLAGVLVTRLFVLNGPGARKESLTIADEVMKIADETGNKDLAMSGRVWRISDLLRQGNRPAIDTEIALLAKLAEELREPRCRFLAAIHQTTRALLSADAARRQLHADSHASGDDL